MRASASCSRCPVTPDTCGAPSRTTGRASIPSLANAPSSQASAARASRPTAQGSACRSPAGSRARAAGTSWPGRDRAAVSCSSCRQSGSRHARGRTLAAMTARKMLNKVPEVTLFFWVIKIMCTTVGETAADYVNDNLGFGLVNTTYVAGAILAVLLVVQFSLRRYVPPAYWAVVVVISVFGTLITDNMSDLHNVPLTTSTPIFA